MQQNKIKRDCIHYYLNCYDNMVINENKKINGLQKTLEKKTNVLIKDIEKNECLKKSDFLPHDNLEKKTANKKYGNNRDDMILLENCTTSSDFKEQNMKKESEKKIEESQYKFFCSVCYFTTNNKYDYNKHILTKKHIIKIDLIKKQLKQSKKKEYKCNLCEKIFDKYKNFWYHTKKCTGVQENVVKLYTCKNCDKTYVNYKSYWGHTKKCTEPVTKIKDIVKKYCCKNCKKQYSNYKSYWSHLQVCKEIKPQFVESCVKLQPPPHNRPCDSAPSELRHSTQCDNCYMCKNCNKKYVIYKSYWSHTKVCKQKSNENDENNDIVQKLFLENQELRKFVVEQSKEHIKTTKKLVNEIIKINETTKSDITPSNTIIHNTINGNILSNNYNINLFLNDKCKDAVNLREFINNVQITNADLENNASNGFVNGISKILIENLKSLSIYERPIHCTDVKRETMYIKEDHIWSKEEDYKKLHNAIQEVSRKIMVQFCKWQEDNPEYVDLDSEAGMKYVAITQNSIAGNKRDNYYGKIVKSIAKETFVPSLSKIDKN